MKCRKCQAPTYLATELARSSNRCLRPALPSTIVHRPTTPHVSRLMPKIPVPWRIKAHREAAIALYRSLVAQCRRLPVERSQREELQNVVRNRFRETLQCQSRKELRISFEAGYEAIDHLDAAVGGNTDSTNYILELLRAAPAKIKLSPVRRPDLQEDKKKNLARRAPPDQGPRDKRPSMFDRPLPLSQLSGRRHVPVLFSAGNIPVLRFKKPQPATLSWFIRSRLKQRQKRHDLRYRLIYNCAIAKWEDEWDELVSLREEQRIPPKGEPSWEQAPRMAEQQVAWYLRKEKEMNRVMAEKMQAVVDREKKLFEKEKMERANYRRESAAAVAKK